MANRFSIEAVFKGVDNITKPVTRMQNRVQKFTRSMTKGLRSANRSVNKLVGGLARGAKGLVKWGGVAVAAGITATALALNKVADTADALAKRSRRLKFPIEEFQQWQFVGEQSGLTNEEFNKSVEGMNKRLGELKAGTGSLYTFLSKSDKAFMRQIASIDNSSLAMQMLIEKMQQTKDPMKQAALANAAFGRSGLKMSNIAELGADRIKKLMLEQQQNGVITKKQAEAAEAYNDAISSLKRSIMGFMQSALLPMMPTLTKYARKFREFIIKHKDDVIKRMQTAFHNLKPAIVAVWEKIKEFDKNHGLIEFFTKAFLAITRFTLWLGENSSALITAGKWILGLVVGLKALTAVLTVVNLLMAANPVVLVILAVTALVAIVATAVKHWESLKDVFFSAGEGMDVFIGLVAMATGPIGWLVGAAALVIRHWEPIKAFFAELWSGITKIFDKLSSFKMPKLKMPDLTFGGLFEKKEKPKRFSGEINQGFIDKAANDEASLGFTPHIITPQERISKSIEEKNSNATVTIQDETGRAKVTSGRIGPGLTLASTGSF